MPKQSLITVAHVTFVRIYFFFIFQVRNNAFMQSNWVGTAAMGSIAVPPSPPANAPASEPNYPPIINAAPRAPGRAGPAVDAHEPLQEDIIGSEGKAGHAGSFRPDSVNDDGDDVTVDDSVEVLRSASVVDEELRVRNVISLRVAGKTLLDG